MASLFDGVYDIKWDDDYSLRSAYAICYRYGNLMPHTFYWNDTPITWSIENQAAPEQFESNPWSNPFAVHCIDISELISITGNQVSVDFPPQPFYNDA